MSVSDTAAVVSSLALLRRDFPDDPEVLCTAARIFSQLADHAARDLAERFPKSPQVGKARAGEDVKVDRSMRIGAGPALNGRHYWLGNTLSMGQTTRKN